MLKQSVERRLALRDGGFSLVELVVAMMIIAVVLLLLVAVQISSAITVAEARKLQQATAYANEAAEQMRSIPWNILSRGMYYDFVAKAGGDPLVSGGQLDVDELDGPADPVPLIIAGVGDDGLGTSQNLSIPALPLYTSTGSNKQVRTDPSLVGIEFTVKAYVVEASGIDKGNIVRFAVVVEWPGPRGNVSRTTLWSEAYRGGDTTCGNPDTQPFLAACQANLDASANSGGVSVAISAHDDTPAETALPVVASGDKYSMAMDSATAVATLRTQQVSFVDARVEYGGNTTSSPGIASVRAGYLAYDTFATDDASNPSGWPATDGPTVYTQLGTDPGFENETRVNSSGTPKLDLRIRSDYNRRSSRTASTVNSCKAGVLPPGAPCAITSIENDNTNVLSGSGYLLMYLDGSTSTDHLIRLSRRLSENSGTAGNTDQAWAARFTGSGGSAETGCQTLSGAGCVAAGATRTNADLYLGTVFNSTNYWSSGQSTIAKITGNASCTYYEDSVSVQRGSNQKTTPPSVHRCGRVTYWDGTTMRPVDFDETTNATYNTEPVTWVDGNYTVTATMEIHIQPSSIDTLDPLDTTNCVTDACSVIASSGSIVVTSVYRIEYPGYSTHVLIVTTSINGPSASASFKAAPSAT